jgi:hypothetical protein
VKETLYVKRLTEIDTTTVEKGNELKYQMELSSGDESVRARFTKMDPFEDISVGDTVEVRVTSSQSKLPTKAEEPDEQQEDEADADA